MRTVKQHTTMHSRPPMDPLWCQARLHRRKAKSSAQTSGNSEFAPKVTAKFAMFWSEHTNMSSIKVSCIKEIVNRAHHRTGRITARKWYKTAKCAHFSKHGTCGRKNPEECRFLHVYGPDADMLISKKEIAIWSGLIVVPESHRRLIDCPYSRAREHNKGDCDYNHPVKSLIDAGVDNHEEINPTAPHRVPRNKVSVRHMTSRLSSFVRGI